MIKLDVAKVVFGAFAVPWWRAHSFLRGLALPLIALVTLMLAWYFSSEYISTFWGSLLYVTYGVLFTLFAVTCHRLVLLDQQPESVKLLPRWSRRETRFFVWMLVVWLLCVGAVLGLTMLFGTLALNAEVMFTGSHLKPDELDVSRIRWANYAADVPALYLFARLSLVFPATALDRKVDLKWAWALSENNGWRLVLVVAVLPWIISKGVNLMSRGSPAPLETIVLTVVGIALFAVEIAALSLSYRELTREEQTSQS